MRREPAVRSVEFARGAFELRLRAMLRNATRRAACEAGDRGVSTEGYVLEKPLVLKAHSRRKSAQVMFNLMLMPGDGTVVRRHRAG
jgi:hypothetical protein